MPLTIKTTNPHLKKTGALKEIIPQMSNFMDFGTSGIQKCDLFFLNKTLQMLSGAITKGVFSQMAWRSNVVVGAVLDARGGTALIVAQVSAGPGVVFTATAEE